MGRTENIPKQATDVVLCCADVQSSVDYYTDELGFRLDTIYPADAPRFATISGFGLRVQLESDDADKTRDFSKRQNDSSLIIKTFDPTEFATGRAGMQYRDLIPGRYGGRFIASHIRIPDGGPVPDYVHFHDIQFQLIYCTKGWVRVVYEDQGPPMLLEPGDCFLQPPFIRHRVLECSDHLEVIEMSCPAEHPTSADHEMALPTSDYRPDRDFSGQRFLFHRAKDATWSPWIADDFEYRDIGVAAATNGVASAITVRRSGTAGRVNLQHDAEIRFLFIVAGSATLRSNEREHARLEPGSSAAIPPGPVFMLEGVSRDFEALEVMAPAA